MEKVKTWGFYTLGWSIHPITELRPGSLLREIQLIIFDAWHALIGLQITPLVSEPLCESERKELEDQLSEWLDRCDKSPDEPLSENEARWLIDEAKRFENVLESQLNELKIYHISQKGWFSTATLVERGEELIPREIRKYISDYASNEFRQAGKAIAFELPSAAGFHILRALEDVLRSYYDVVTNGKPRPKNPSMGKYIDLLQGTADEKMLSILKQIKDFHRNPNIHEVVLTMNEVIILLGVVQSAIMVMADAIKKSKAV